MEFRRLLAFGKGSYVISLPKNWVIKNKLKKGELIGVEETALGLSLFTGTETKKNEKKIATITADGKDLKRLKSEIISAYLTNGDIIEVLSKDLHESAVNIKDTFFNLAGMEIMEQTSTRMVATYLIDKKEISIPLILRRMDNITRAMIKDTIDSLKTGHPADNIIQRDADVNRLHFLACREVRIALVNPKVASSIKMSHLDLITSRHVVMRIERIADCQKIIAKNLRLLSLSKDSMEYLKKIYREIEQQYYDVMKSFYNKDYNLSYELEHSTREIQDELNNFLSNHVHSKSHAKNKEGNIATSHIINYLKIMSNSIKYIARNILDSQ